MSPIFQEHDIFDGAGNGLTADSFAGKLLGKTQSGKRLFGYARLPGVDYLQPALSPMPPKVIAQKGGAKIAVEVQNFGQVSSLPTPLRIVQTDAGKDIEVAAGLIAPLAPFEKTVVDRECATPLANVKSSTIRVIINPKGQSPVTISRRLPRQL